MAPPGRAGADLDGRDYWGAIVAGFLELFIACLVLLTAGVSLLASKLIKIFDLPYPCTYLGLQHERSVLCEQHRRLALLNLQLHDSCGECLRELTAARIEQNARVLPLFQEPRVRELHDGRGDDHHDNEEDELGDDGFGTEAIAHKVTSVAVDDKKNPEVPSPRVGATGDRCVKRKFAKIFVEELPHDQVSSGVKSSEEEKDRGDATSDLSVESVKAAFQAEKDALNSLYVELEEERNASAIAANEAMAMITRLQEEKAAVQMEARQYQRMVEEKAEYDQEAITLLKEILFKREQEKFVLEKEVESYRKRLLPARDGDDVDDWLPSRLLLEGGGGGGFGAGQRKPAELSRWQGTNLLEDFDRASSHHSGSVSGDEATGNGAEELGFQRNASAASPGGDYGGDPTAGGDIDLDRGKRSDQVEEALSNGNSDLDLRTTSMVMRDNFRLAMENDIRELTSRLQVLEDDRLLLTQVVQSLTADKPDHLRELAQHFRLKKAAAELAVPPVSQVLGCHHECILTS